MNSLKKFQILFFKNLCDNFVFEKNPHIGICVSGGPDSVALLALMNDWIKKKKGEIFVLHFNHNLRRDSINEVKFVKKISQSFGNKCIVVNWLGSKPKTNIMNKAREERYRRIIEICKKKKILHLMTAHHHDDRIETYQMRIARKNSSFGLLSIPTKRMHESLQIIRPLIDFKKGDLLEICRFYNLPWIQDPSNSNDLFERSRYRKILKKLTNYQINSISNQIDTNNNKNLILEEQIVTFCLKNLKFHKYGVFELDEIEFKKQNNKIKMELLRKILTTCSGKIYGPNLESIKFLLKKIKLNDKYKFTLHSCVIKIKEKKMLFYREYSFTHKGIEKEVNVDKGSVFLWDSRFRLISKKYNLSLFTFSENIWLKLKENFTKKKNKKNIPFEILKTLPVLFIRNLFFIPFLSDEDEMKKYGIDFYFYPKIQLSKKNFF